MHNWALGETRSTFVDPLNYYFDKYYLNFFKALKYIMLQELWSFIAIKSASI